MELRGKTILVISPQRWGKMHVAKHHYAIELAKRGNQVIFLNPPDQSLEEAFKWENETELNGLSVLTYRPFFSLNLRFHLRRIYDILMSWQVERLLRFLQQPIDIIWCFEPNLYSDLHAFKALLNIYHPVDELFYDYQIKVGYSAHLILSVTYEILSKFKAIEVPKHFIHHGLAEEFINDHCIIKNYSNENFLKIGYTGNLLRPDIDIPVFTQIITENPEFEFHLWGTYQANNSNFGGEVPPENATFIDFLLQSKNVYLHGVVRSKILAQVIQEMDAFLICYDIKKDQSKGTNYHKIMEFLSTGKVIITNNVTTYQGLTDLVCMPDCRENNYLLPSLFKATVKNIGLYNSYDKQKARIDFARQNQYSEHINRIEALNLIRDRFSYDSL